MNGYRLIVSGHVQNVNFRYNVKLLADKLELFGFVRNLPNKNVEIYFLGYEKQFQTLLKFIKNNPGNSNVKNVLITKISKLSKFDNFEILY